MYLPMTRIQLRKRVTVSRATTKRFIPCSQCSAKNLKSAVLCRKCGASLVVEMPVDPLYFVNLIQAMQNWQCQDIEVTLTAESAEMVAYFQDCAPEPMLLRRLDPITGDGESEADRAFYRAARGALALRPARLTLERSGTSFTTLVIEPDKTHGLVGRTLKVKPLIRFLVEGGARNLEHEKEQILSATAGSRLPIHLKL